MPDLMAYELEDIRTMIDELGPEPTDIDLIMFIDRILYILYKAKARSVRDGVHGKQKSPSQTQLR